MSRNRFENRSIQDEQIVSDFMTALAGAQTEEANIPPPGQLWWRTQLSRRQSAAQKAMRPLVITEGTAVVTVAAGGALWLIVWGIPGMPAPIAGALAFLLLGLSAVVAGLTVKTLIAPD